MLFTDMSSPLQGRPLGAYRIASHLREKGYRVKVIWLWNYIDPKIMDLVIKQHVRPGIKAVGISSTLMFSNKQSIDRNLFGVSDDEFRRRLQLFKKIDPNIKILVGGGNIAYIDPAILKNFKEVDYFVKGQGESAVENIMDSISNNTRFDPKDIIRPPIVSDSFYPFHDFNSSTNFFSLEDGIMPGEPLPLEIARGCIFKCSFCSYDLLNKNPTDYTKSLDNLVREIKNNYDLFGTTSYYIVDDIINESEYKVDLLSKVAESVPFDLQFSGYLRLDLVRKFPKRIKRLRDIGLYAGFFGIESVNDNSGKAVGKGLGLRRIAEGLEVMVDLYGDKFYGDAGMILGLPHDNPETKYKVLEWVNNPLTSRVIRRISVQPLGIDTKFGHSEIDRDPGKFGYEMIGVGPARRLSNEAWKTKLYNSKMAFEDSRWINDQLRESRPFSQRVDVWSLPYTIWIDDHNDRETTLNYVRYNHGAESYQSWYDRIESLYHGKKKKYVIEMGKHQ